MEKKQKTSNIHIISDPQLEPYYIQFDQSCYTVVKKITASESGKTREATIGYYSGLPACLRAIAEGLTNTQDYSTLKSYIEEYKDNVDKLQKLVLE